MQRKRKSVLDEMTNKPARERLTLTREQALKAYYDDIDPMHYAGEAFTDEDEIARPRDVRNNPHLLARVLNSGHYWPTRGMK